MQKIKIKQDTVLLVKPQTFMNLSGKAVRSLLHFYKIPLEDLLVIHDDKDLSFGNLKFQKKRGAGGHNGVADIEKELGSNNYARLKMGIYPKKEDSNTNDPSLENYSKMNIGAEPTIDTSSLVLSPFSKKEQDDLPEIVTKAKEAILFFLQEGLEKTANKFNS